jgi:hypothetical protein
MKKLLFVAVAFTLLVSAPVVSFSQGFSLLPGNFFGSPGAYRGDYGSPWLDPLSFYVGWGTDVVNPRFTFDSGGGGVSSLSHRWPLRGLWLGVGEKLNVSERCGINVEAWWLIPSTAVGTEESVVGITQFIVTDFPAGFFITTPAAVAVNWNTRPDWWYIDGRLACSCAGRNFNVLAGFRYDHFSTRFEFPFSPTTGFAFDPNNQADITVNSYIPYVGFEYSCMGAGSGLCMRLIGFPWVPADVVHSETGEAGAGLRATSTGNFNSGRYFIEFFGEYSRTVFGGAGIGAWFRWQDLSGRGPITTTINPGGLAISDAFVFDRNTVAFGGKATLNFNLPF